MTTSFESLPVEVQERLAELEHIQWAHWTKYMLDNLTLENMAKWWKQSQTSYSELSEVEKEADRKWARKVVEALWPQQFGEKEEGDGR